MSTNGAGGGLDTPVTKDNCNNEMKDASDTPEPSSSLSEPPPPDGDAGAKPPVAPPRARRGLAATKAAKAKLQGMT